MGRVFMILLVIIALLGLLWLATTCGALKVLEVNWWTIDMLQYNQPIGMEHVFWVDQLDEGFKRLLKDEIEIPGVGTVKTKGNGCAIASYESWTKSGYTIPWDIICPYPEDEARGHGKPKAVGIAGIFWFQKSGSAEGGGKGPFMITGQRLRSTTNDEIGNTLRPKDFNPESIPDPKEAKGPNPLVLANCKARQFMGYDQPVKDGMVKFSRCDEFGFDGSNMLAGAPNERLTENHFIVFVNFGGIRVEPLSKFPALLSWRPADQLGPLPDFTKALPTIGK